MEYRIILLTTTAISFFFSYFSLFMLYNECKHEYNKNKCLLAQYNKLKHDYDNLKNHKLFIRNDEFITENLQQSIENTTKLDNEIEKTQTINGLNNTEEFEEEEKEEEEDENKSIDNLHELIQCTLTSNSSLESINHDEWTDVNNIDTKKRSFIYACPDIAFFNKTQLPFIRHGMYDSTLNISPINIIPNKNKNKNIIGSIGKYIESFF